MPSRTLVHPVDAFVISGAEASKNYSTRSRLHTRLTGPARKTVILFTQVWPYAATIKNTTRLRLWQGPAVVASGITVTVKRITSKWGAGTITFNRYPTIGATTVTMQKTSPAAGTLWDIDVSPLVQEQANSTGTFYGFEVTININQDIWFHAEQSSSVGMRPTMFVEWTTEPKAPTGLSPSGGRSVSLDKPTLRWQRDSADVDDLVSAQIQLNTVDVWTGGVTYDSGEQAMSAPSWNLASTAYAGLADAASIFWRVRHKNSSGIWSKWSNEATGVADSFRRDTKGVLAFTNPAASPNNFVEDPTPPFAWTFTGRTQRSFQLYLWDMANLTKPIWTSGKITSTTLNNTPPEGILKVFGGSYRAGIEVWDTINREETPGDPSSVMVTRDFTLNTNGTQTLVTSVTATVQSPFPSVLLGWTDGTMADEYVIEQSDDGALTWRVIKEIIGPDAFNTGTTYKALVVAGGRQERRFAIRRKSNNQAGNRAPITVASIPTVSEWLALPDGTFPIMLANAKVSPDAIESSTAHFTANGGAVLITEPTAKRSGTVTGELAEGTTSMTVATLKANWDKLNSLVGTPMVFLWGSIKMDVVAFNFFETEQIMSGNKTEWAVSFDYLEI